MAMMISRRAVLAGMSTTVLAGGRAYGDSTYPNRPIQIIVPATAGGQSDIGARRIGELLHEALGQPFVIDNRTGAGGSIATTLLSRADKDGYTLGMASDTTVLINPIVVPDAKYKLEDFQLLSPLYVGAFALAVAKDFPAKTVSEFIVEVKRRSSLLCGMFGSVSSPRLVAEMFMAAADVKLEPVPYRGETEAVRDMLSGVIPSFFGTTSNLIAQHEAGNLRILALSAKERVDALKDVPTFVELGFKPVVYTWFHGLMLPGGTPPAIVEKLSKTLIPLIGGAKFKAQLNADLVPTPMTPAEFTAMARESRDRVIQIIRDRKLLPT
jgi:tripartite-type tricarboxylate transporter receptor subunit TctC